MANLSGSRQDVDRGNSSFTTRPNFGAGAGSSLLEIVAVAGGEPGVPLTSCAGAVTPAGYANSAEGRPITTLWRSVAFFEAREPDWLTGSKARSEQFEVWLTEPLTKQGGRLRSALANASAQRVCPSSPTHH